jgi:hypothetical protein
MSLSVWLAEWEDFVPLWKVMLRPIRTYSLALCVLAVLLLASCQRFQVSGQGTSERNRHLLFDFRQLPQVESGSNSLPAAMLAAVFPKYSQKTGGCAGSARQANDGPRVLGKAEGAFTEVGASQTAYLLDPGNCENDPEAFGGQRLAIFSGDKLLKVTRVSATELLSTYDLDLDGRRELLLATANTRQGLYGVNAHLLSIEAQTYKVAENFGRVRFEDCRSKDGTITAVKLDYLPEVDPKTLVPVKKLPRFTAEVYRASCPKQGQPMKWVRVQGSGE